MTQYTITTIKENANTKITSILVVILPNLPTRPIPIAFIRGTIVIRVMYWLTRKLFLL